MMWIRQTRCERPTPEFKFPLDKIVRPTADDGRRIPVACWDSVNCNIPVHDGHPRVRFEIDDSFVDEHTTVMRMVA